MEMRAGYIAKQNNSPSTTHEPFFCMHIRSVHLLSIHPFPTLLTPHLALTHNTAVSKTNNPLPSSHLTHPFRPTISAFPPPMTRNVASSPWFARNRSPDATSRPTICPRNGAPSRANSTVYVWRPSVLLRAYRAEVLLMGDEEKKHTSTTASPLGCVVTRGASLSSTAGRPSSTGYPPSARGSLESTTACI
jgi:hypothetical protein